VSYYVEERIYCNRCDGEGLIWGREQVEHCPACDGKGYTSRMVKLEETKMDKQTNEAKDAARYRAWDDSNKWMLPNFDNWIDFDGNYWEPPDKTFDTPHQEIVKRDDVVVMRFIGLADKNGKAICESDVIRTPRGDWGVIVWNAPFFEVTVSETQSSMYSREWLTTCEVIGNIYENPELLKEQTNEP